MVVCCGYNFGAADEMLHLAKTALRWSPGGSEWVSLPDLPEKRPGLACVSLPDGQTLAIGGVVTGQQQQAVASVLALASDGTEWSAVAPMDQIRFGAAAAVLPDSKVLVAGGQATDQADSVLGTAELYDLATNTWTALPDMAHERAQFGMCVLPSVRMDVMGGFGVDGHGCKDCEAFDPVKRTWEALPEMAVHVARRNPATAPVAGGMVVAGMETVDLFDEESGR